MKNHEEEGRPAKMITRRSALRSVGIALATAPFAQLIACSGNGDTSTGGGSGGAGGAGTTTGTGTTGTSTSSSTAAKWATGGTAAMKGNYEDPFSAGLGSACDLTCTATLGPCYAKTVERKDISEGHNGLPVRLAFLVVDPSCKPIQGATVDIWHCGPEGLYSGEDASDFCTTGDATARAARWFRGVQTTDAEGRVDFDTCFPGWYSSRTVHIHFTIKVGDKEYVTSQFVFDDALDDEIISSQPLYKDRGARDTKNTTDNVVGGEEDMSKYAFQTKQMDDGAMLAWKAIVLRSSLTDATCAIKGAGGGMGPGGGPGGGPPPSGGGPGATTSTGGV